MNPEMQDQLYDIYGLWYQPWYHNKYYFSLAVIAGLCLFGLITWFVHKTWFEKYDEETVEENVFGLIFLAESQIEGDKKNVQDGYAFLTHAMRLYISEKYERPVGHLTDLEIQNVLVSCVGEKYGPKLQDLFKRSASVKFQSGNLSNLELRDFVSDLKKDIELARQFFMEAVENQNIKE